MRVQANLANIVFKSIDTLREADSTVARLNCKAEQQPLQLLLQELQVRTLPACGRVATLPSYG